MPKTSTNYFSLFSGIKSPTALNKLAGLFLICCCSVFTVQAQEYNIILGRPTDTSITASIMFYQNVQFFLDYGTVSGTYPHTTPVYTNVANRPDEIDLNGLIPATQYFYRLHYKLLSASSYTISPEYNFHTQRATGSTFTFTIEADEHLYDKKGILNMYNVTLANEAKDKPDFMMTLGDIFGDDHNPLTITSGALDTLHRNYRPLLGKICHSIPFYV